MLTPSRYVRKPFEVDAVEVKPENIEEVAQWCGGDLRTSDLSKAGGKEGHQQYIKVPVKRPLSDRQTRAYYGDWVLVADGNFKVYSPKAFTGSFQEKVDHMLDTVENMEKRAEQEEKLDFEEAARPQTVDFVSPGR